VNQRILLCVAALGLASIVGCNRNNQGGYQSGSPDNGDGNGSAYKGTSQAGIVSGTFNAAGDVVQGAGETVQDVGYGVSGYDNGYDYDNGYYYPSYGPGYYPSGYYYYPAGYQYPNGDYEYDNSGQRYNSNGGYRDDRAYRNGRYGGGRYNGEPVGDVGMQQLQSVSPSTAKRVQQGKQLNRNDVRAMSQAGFSDQAIEARIDATNSTFRLSNSDIKDLQNAGVSPEVISYMVSTGPQPQPAPRPGMRYNQRPVQGNVGNPSYAPAPAQPAYRGH